MIFGDDRTELRRLFAEAWRRRVERLPVEPLHDQIAAVVALHPEYQAVVADPEALERDWTPLEGETNPFLHMGMHLALREQCSTDRPAGIRSAMQRLTERLGDDHAAEHAAFECLGRALWEAQRAGRPPDEQAYLECIRQRAGGG